ncbi:hypothetical protein AOLI_G00114520 [Acnodon oligacanthus]
MEFCSMLGKGREPGNMTALPPPESPRQLANEDDHDDQPPPGWEPQQEDHPSCRDSGENHWSTCDLEKNLADLTAVISPPLVPEVYLKTGGSN